MSCTRHEFALFLYTHGQSRGLAQFMLQNHLTSCESCRARWARWSVERDRLRRAVAPLPVVDHGAQSLLDTVAARIRAERQLSPEPPAGAAGGAQSRMRRMVLLGTIAAVLALAIGAMASFWEPAHEQCMRALGMGSSTDRPVLPYCPPGSNAPHFQKPTDPTQMHSPPMSGPR
jgi:anti-sigma factor RsiW